MKRLLITGSEGNVGAALCADLNADFTIEKTVRPGREGLALDVEDPASWQAVVGADDEPLYGLIHCVGSFALEPLEEVTPEAWRATISSNLDSAFFAYRACRARLRTGAGRIIFFSLAGLDTKKPEPNITAYAVAKSGLELLARSIAQVEAPHQLTCNIIAPGLLAGTSAADIARIAPPLGRPARRAELNAAVRYLLSDAAAQVSGTILPLSGAWRLR